ncbi:etoposide-induced protein 2.4 (EI24) domain-containing protein [Hirsutella rhossiliensis]|uniref:Etoposide-induced protein 2.4 (EI24) domain-containing protein n=1 Tax=Hirsutella rhossiliensis TaxID=111463 RepID=A0A9P8MRU4_9HYPO|nr:etoposide-induced protein 2.4 (EI24) domain-containing protein [Hirsutella rhossiliensis]KAH0960257.1 etoposide-induced protein 2.4 (EI24) domain-containing protein [Hirsutella rhossiliensis]
MDGTVPVSIDSGSRPRASYPKRAAIGASYPLRGIWYFVRNREFWPLFVGRLLPLSLISLVVYLVLFTFAFLPQYAFLAIFHGWGAWVNAVVLTLGEGLVIIQGLFEGFFVDECRVDVFDATMIKLGLQHLVSPHRLLFVDASNAVKMLGKPTSPAIYQPWSIIQIVELIVFLPLNLVPYVGTPAFIIITGTRIGKLSHYRWFQLRGLSKHEQKREIRSLTWDYVWFGTVAMLLELIPILSFFFLLTTTAGSAMWAARMEEERRRSQTVVDPHFNARLPSHSPPSRSPPSRSPPSRSSPPPPYSDHAA